jgi:cytochrome c5
VSEQHDRQFIQTFSAVLAALAAFTVLIILLAISIHNNNYEGSQSSARQAAVEERLRPVADVYAGETGRAAARAAAEEAAASSAPQVAFGGSTDGQMIYNQACASCHESGAAGAPMLQASDWTDRLPKGRETLVSHAINGFNAMPAKGGRMDLSDEQVAASVDYMVAQVE